MKLAAAYESADSLQRSKQVAGKPHIIQGGIHYGSTAQHYGNEL